MVKVNKKKIKSIPHFKNEDEEDQFWSTHDLIEYFDMSKAIHMEFPNLKPTTKTISLRLPAMLLNNLKKIANKKDVPYQSLIKVFLDEKVKDEFHSA